MKSYLVRDFLDTTFADTLVGITYSHIVKLRDTVHHSFLSPFILHPSYIYAPQKYPPKRSNHFSVDEE